VKLPVHRAGLPGNVISFYIVPPDPAYLPAAGRQGGACGALAGQMSKDFHQSARCYLKRLDSRTESMTP